MISVIGNTASGSVIATVPIDVERSDSPSSITAGFPQLELAVGGRVALGVTGTYSDRTDWAHDRKVMGSRVTLPFLHRCGAPRSPESDR
jgi:hypothetical protein